MVLIKAPVAISKLIVGTHLKMIVGVPEDELIDFSFYHCVASSDNKILMQ